MKDIRNKELSFLTPQKRNYSTIIIFVVIFILFGYAGYILQTSQPPVVESTFFETLSKKNYKLNIGIYDCQWYQDLHEKDPIIYGPCPAPVPVPVPDALNTVTPLCGNSSHNSGICKLDFMYNPFNPKPIELITNVHTRPNLIYSDSLMTIIYSDSTGSSVRSKETVKKEISKRVGGLKYIYSKYLKGNVELKGKIKIKMIIAPSGTVIRAVVLESSLETPKLEREIIKRIKKWDFERVTEGTTTVIRIFEFSTK